MYDEMEYYAEEWNVRVSIEDDMAFFEDAYFFFGDEFCFGAPYELEVDL